MGIYKANLRRWVLGVADGELGVAALQAQGCTIWRAQSPGELAKPRGCCGSAHSLPYQHPVF